MQETYRKIAALVLGLAPGSAWSVYLQMVGFYVLNFQSEMYYILMILALFVPYPIIGSMQGALDEYFDRMFSTKTTYIFRTVGVQCVLGGIIGLWMGIPQTPVSVLIIGFLLGALNAAVFSSGLQMIAALDPKILFLVHFGREFGGVLPTIVLLLTHFTPEAPLSLFRSVLASVFALIGLSIIILTSINHMDVLDDSYCALDSRPPAEARSSGIKWVPWWSASLCYTKVMSFCLISTMPFLLTPTEAQILAMCMLGGFLAGRLLVVPFQYLPSFQTAPQHLFMASIQFIRTVLFVLLLWGMIYMHHYQTHDGTKLLRVGWTITMALDAFSLSFVDFTTSMFVDIAYRKTVTRRNGISAFSGIVLGVVCTIAIMVPSLRLELQGLANNSAIPAGGALQQSIMH